MNKIFYIDSNSTLFESKLFRWLIRIPVYSSIILAMFVYSENAIHFSFESEALSLLLKTFQVPLLTLSLVVPLTALSAALHRSEQTALQIQSQAIQNNFANHFKHLEEFKNTFKDTAIKPWKDIESFHSGIYPNTIRGSVSPKPLDIGANEYLKDLIIKTHNSPLRLFSISRQVFEDICHSGNIDRSIDMDELITPIDIVNLLQCLRKAYAFSGLHPAPFEINEELKRLVYKLQDLADTYQTFLANERIVLQTLYSNIDEKVFAQITNSLSVNQIHGPLATAFIWNKLRDQPSRIEIENNYPVTMKYWVDDLFPKLQQATLSGIDPLWEGAIRRFGVTNKAHLPVTN